MSNIEFLAKALSYHIKGKDASFLKEAKDYNKDGKIDDHEKDHSKEEDRFKKIEKDIKALKKEEDELEEVKTYDSGWQDPKPERKDQYGNTIKNVAKNLAKQGMTAAKKEKETEIEEGALAGHIRAVRGWMADGKSREQSHELAKKRGMHPKIVDDHYDNQKKDVSEELIDDFIDYMTMMEDFAELFEAEELSIDEAIEEWHNDEEVVEENFGKMSKTKRLVAAKKAAITKARTGNWGGGRPKGPKKPKSIQPSRRIRLKRRA